MIPNMSVYKERWEIESDDIVKPGVEAVQEALRKLGNPEQKLNVIHVAGTNGKGSTIAFMEAILKEHGFSTGVFSSPAIIDIHDQIRIDGNPISEDELNNSFHELKEAGISGLLTDFELLTAAAFCTWRRIAPDYVLLETGMGGTLDSTNVVTPLVSVITSIALEHSAFLGTTLAEIAGHKAGIIKNKIPVVIGPMQEESLETIQRIALEQESPLAHYGIDLKMEGTEQEVFVGTKTIPLPTRKMKGPHQGVNAALAIEALLAAKMDLNGDRVAKAIANAQLNHRFQEIQPGLFLDGAHNPAAAKALAKTIQSEFPGEKVDFVMGMIKGKDIKKTLNALMPVAGSFTFLTFSHPQAEQAGHMIENCSHQHKRVINAVNDTITLEKRGELKIIVTGSLYLLSSLKYYLKEK
ncbi:folylpolyglutamate synthase/dihydrofolate synthase family protein [Filibacter tadaridae]|uniref:tetrahydrofolate synthase n=1 Tax=Filibacter tadaridae TaxID=2483811 RepID=A0A3P5XP19_9BACL|nr:folylpolyglutamate synthase/dihydrofolate synthase family protein [Filibacter tadaridae]VDC32635.1 Folylpolyglutamate synthase [Filibacter tadaridae]